MTPCLLLCAASIDWPLSAGFPSPNVPTLGAPSSPTWSGVDVALHPVAKIPSTRNAGYQAPWLPTVPPDKATNRLKKFMTRSPSKLCADAYRLRGRQTPQVCRPTSQVSDSGAVLDRNRRGVGGGRTH